MGAVPARRKAARPGTVAGYVRVSTEEQKESGLGLDAQRSVLGLECQRRGFELVQVFADEGVSAKDLNRPELQNAIEFLESGEASILMVSKLDRLSRSVHDFTGLLARAESKRWALVAADIGVDTSTPAGEAMANVMASFAQLERRLIGQRTSDALQVLLKQGKILGRRQRSTDEVVTYIRDARRDGKSLREIAAELNAAEVPTSQGGQKWYPSTVAAVLARKDYQQ